MIRKGIRFEVPRYECPPKGCGLAYLDYEKGMLGIYFPFPLNWVIGISLKIWHEVRHSPYILVHRDKFKQ